MSESSTGAPRGVPLVDVVDGSIFGGKALQLGRALRAGLPVPNGIALSFEDTDLAAARGGAFPNLGHVLAGLGGRVAVRSSAIGEDGADASFAGQHATILDLRTEAAVIDAIISVRSSAHTESALAYRSRLGIEGSPRMAVVIQTVVDADRAGVLFTKNPVSGADERVIEGTWGLGEAVVSGLVTPDHFRVSKTGALLESIAGEKDIAIRPCQTGGTHEVPVEDDLVHALCLSKADIARLHDLACLCETLLGGPLDLEWAFAKDSLFLLQQRVITRAPA